MYSVNHLPDNSSPQSRKVASRLFVVTVLMSLFLSACASTPWYNEPPPKPDPLSPINGALLGTSSEVIFTWRAAEMTEFYEFHIFNAVNSDIDRYMVKQINPKAACRGDVCSIGLQLSLPESPRHAWRVRAVNVAGASSWTRSVFSWTP